MNWKSIQLSEDHKTFELNGEQLFKRRFKSALKFHEPGIAPVCDDEGWYHIDIKGVPIYNNRYDRVFGYYCYRAAVVENGNWFHITPTGRKAYDKHFSWAGNYQQELCTVRDHKGYYLYIDKNGKYLNKEKYLYAGDFRDGYAGVKTAKGWKHIDRYGENLNGKYFHGLGVFHKGFATARDDKGWFHIDYKGCPLYPQRYKSVEPFYNGFSFAERLEGDQVTVDEKGNEKALVK